MTLNVNKFLTPFLKHRVIYPVTRSIHDLKGDTIGQGYKQPVDIVAYKGGRALLTTTSGHLLALDVSTPQSPRIATPLRSNTYSAFRVAVAPEYAYNSSECGVQSSECQQNVIDLAVTSSMQGKINTVDVTDPYNPTVMGTAKDSDGNEVIVTVADIVISKASGLVYITAGNSVYIIDVKDPYNPKLLNIVTQTPIEPGSTTTTELGYSPALVEKDGWVYLANQNKGMRVLDLDPVYLRHYCGEAEFKSNLVCTDYYPALGTKTIMLQGKDANFADLESPAKVKLISVTPAEHVNVYIDTDTTCNGLLCTQFNAGLAKFYVKTDSTFDPAANPYITLDFEIDLSAYSWWQQLLLQTSTYGGLLSPFYNMDAYKTSVRLRVRNNSNVSLGEVLNGTAVFAYDNGGGLDNEGNFKSQGKYINTANDNEKKLAFVQELLNQVVPRKRDAAATYVMTPEDGVYSDKTKSAIAAYRTKFNVSAGVNADGDRIANTRIKFAPDPSGNIKYEDLETSPTTTGTYSNDNTSDTFRKLMKDYSHRLNSADSEPWLNKVIDKETLVGAKKRIPAVWSSVIMDLLFPTDARINGTPENTRNDTGLYELYQNAVVPYINFTIAESERYAGLRGDMGETPTDQWYGRKITGQGPSDHGPAVSYSYGGKMRVEDFNAQVASSPLCMAEIAPKITLITQSSTGVGLYNDNSKLARAAFVPDAHAIDTSYKGDLRIVEDASGSQSCQPGSGQNRFKPESCVIFCGLLIFGQ